MGKIRSAFLSRNSTDGSPAGRRRSLGRRLTLLVAVTVVLGFSTLLGIQSISTYRDMREINDAGNLSLTRRLANEASEVVRWKKIPAIEDFLGRILADKESLAATVAAFDDRGALMARKQAETLPEFAVEAAFAEARAGLENGEVVTVNAPRHFVVFSPLRFGKDARIVGYIAAAWSLEKIDAHVRAGLIRDVGVVGIAVLTVVLLLLIILRRQVLGPVAAVTTAMERLADGELDIHVPEYARHDEIGAMIETLRVFRQNARDRQQLAQENQRQKQRADAERHSTVQALADAVENQVQSIAGAVAAAARDMQGNAESLAHIARETSTQAATVAAASQQALCNVQTVAAATEQLSVSIREIGENVAESSRMAHGAVNEAEQTNATVAGLAEAVERIGTVVQLIQSIASQTNLLALNATIEAARAGEAGKGFAVVATEVKNLAAQTAKATEEISDQISAIQAATGGAVAAIRNIGTTISHISEIAAGIASAVEQQAAATQEITRNVQEATRGTVAVNQSIRDVNRGADQTGSAAGEVLCASSDLSRQSGELSRQVGSLIASIRHG